MYYLPLEIFAPVHIISSIIVLLIMYRYILFHSAEKSRIFGRRVLSHSVVDNSDFSPFRLTVPSSSPYDKETIRATYFKQRGSLWAFISSCSCSFSATFSA
jgi:hypothetical protein